MSDIFLIKLEDVKANLRAGGYGGLYIPGECACEIDDLAPCGECDQQEGEELINGCCKAGFKHIDPQRPDFWVITDDKEPPSPDSFGDIFMCV